MNEKFQAPQAEVLVGNFDDFNPNLLSDGKKKFSTTHEGEVINNPELILKRIFHEYATEPNGEIEIQKTARDLEIIELAKDAVKQIAEEFGRTEFIDISNNHIHFVEAGGVEKYTEGRLSDGSHASVLGELMVDRGDDLSTAITTFHELWHTIASYNAIQVTTDGRLDWYRAGFSLKSRDGEKSMFSGLQEALVGHATKRFVEEFLRRRPDFSELIKEAESSVSGIDTSRQHELDELNRLLDAIVERNPGEYDDREELLNMFMMADVTGNLLPVARLIDSSFGKGSFRRLGKF
jgi:hypothetical protein